MHLTCSSHEQVHAGMSVCVTRVRHLLRARRVKGNKPLSSGDDGGSSVTAAVSPATSVIAAAGATATVAHAAVGLAAALDEDVVMRADRDASFVCVCE